MNSIHEAVPTFSLRQEEILEEIEAIFISEGFRRLTLGQLAKRVRCSLATLYQLAPTKEELFLLVLDRMWARVGANARRLVDEHADPVRRLEVFLVDGAAIFRPPWVGAFFADIRAYGPARDLFARHMALGTDFMRRLVEEGIETGQFRPVSAPLVAKMLETLTFQTTDDAFLDAVGMEAMEAQQAITEVLLRGLTALKCSPTPPQATNRSRR